MTSPHSSAQSFCQSSGPWASVARSAAPVSWASADPLRAITWEPGQDTGDGSVRFGRWVWRYDLGRARPSGPTVTLSYDWSAVPGFLRQHIGFPPFPPDHLGNSLSRLAGLVAA